MKRCSKTAIVCAALIIGILAPMALAIEKHEAQRLHSTAFQSESPLLGRWKVRFTNGVKERCNVNADATTSVTEPLRTAAGNAEVRGRSVVIFYEDNRVERWTSVGDRYVVEHWFPAATFETERPVLGIADREK